MVTSTFVLRGRFTPSEQRARDGKSTGDKGVGPTLSQNGAHSFPGKLPLTLPMLLGQKGAVAARLIQVYRHRTEMLWDSGWELAIDAFHKTISEGWNAGLIKYSNH